MGTKMDLTTEAKPFLKWVGGKGQLLRQLEAALPKELSFTEFTYFEPFIGGGAMLFFMLKKFPNIQRVVINDINKNLTEAYRVIKETPEDLVSALRNIERCYYNLTKELSRKDFYLEKRVLFNEAILSSVDKTALLLFLNKTCFNGMYRENTKGMFNVPFGKYQHPTICDEKVIYADSLLLNHFNVEIMTGDYWLTSNAINDGEYNFFYFDPPYRPLNKTSSFNSYVKDIFDDSSQRALAKFCRFISERHNCLWMLSNSDCSSKNPADLFFETIYEGFDFQRVFATRSINAQPNKRGKLTELLIRNYTIDL